MSLNLHAPESNRNDTSVRRRETSHTPDASDRRGFLKGAGVAGLSALAASAMLQPAPAESPLPKPLLLYFHGMVWNLSLPGVLGELRLSLDLAAPVAGASVAAIHDALHPEFNCQVAVTNMESGKDEFDFEGLVVDANLPENLGLEFRMAALVSGADTIAWVRLGENIFRGAGVLAEFSESTKVYIGRWEVFPKFIE
jgi:hypothetical protein